AARISLGTSARARGGGCAGARSRPDMDGGGAAGDRLEAADLVGGSGPDGARGGRGLVVPARAWELSALAVRRSPAWPAGGADDHSFGAGHAQVGREGQPGVSTPNCFAYSAFNRCQPPNFMGSAPTVRTLVRPERIRRGTSSRRS